AYAIANGTAIPYCATKRNSGYFLRNGSADLENIMKNPNAAPTKIVVGIVHTRPSALNSLNTAAKPAPTKIPAFNDNGTLLTRNSAPLNRPITKKINATIA